MRSRFVAALILALAAACPLANANSPRVTFLPPLGSAPPGPGESRNDLSPTVAITEIDSVTGVELATLATFPFAGSGAPGQEVVRATSRQHYQVSWQVGNYTLAPGGRYRVSVQLSAQTVGSADVLVDAQGGLRGASGSNLAGAGSRTVPIKFRLSAPVACSGAEQPGCAGSLPCRSLQIDFAPPSTLATGPGPNAVVCADFNGDGRLDTAVANVYGANVVVRLGLGDGTFHPAASYAVGSGPRGLVAADLDSDGRQDLVSANHYDATVSVLIGRGDGTFAAQRQFPAASSGGRPTQVVVADVNGDTIPDVVTSSEVQDDIGVMLGEGAGGLSVPVRHAVGDFPHGMAVADLNCDGLPDLAVANYGVYRTLSDVSVLLGLVGGGFAPARDYPAGFAPWSVAVADFDQDGDIDLAVTNYGVVGTGGSVGLLLGLGDGTFGPVTNFPVGDQPYAGVLGDFNHDGKWDMGVANAGDSTLSLLIGNGDGSFLPQRVFAAGGTCVGVGAGDLDGDGRVDVVTANGDADTLSIVLNRSW